MDSLSGPRWVAGVHLQNVDASYPSSAAIEAMLPGNLGAHSSVLSDPTAATAIMRITDAEVAKASTAGRGATKHLVLGLIVDGKEELLTGLSEERAQAWLKARGAQLHGEGRADMFFQRKIMERMLKQIADKEATKIAMARLSNIISHHEAS